MANFYPMVCENSVQVLPQFEVPSGSRKAVTRSKALELYKQREAKKNSTAEHTRPSNVRGIGLKESAEPNSSAQAAAKLPVPLRGEKTQAWMTASIAGWP